MIIWDRQIRAFHWLLVFAVAASALTGFVLGTTMLRWHLVAGAAVAALLVWRGIWGFCGGPYARFAGFTYAPATLLAYLRTHSRHLGHNPLGALMVFALLGGLAALLATGTVSLGGLLKQGPLRAWLSYAAGLRTLHLHKIIAVLLLGLIAAHLAGVAFESWHGRENLVRAMVTGQKRADPTAAPEPPFRALPRRAALLTLGLLLAGGGAIGALAALPGRGVPPATPDPAYAEQCGSCHLAFPPSLAPATTWNAILDHMNAHFGQDTGLTPDIVAQMRTILDANDATHWDSLPSWRLRSPDPGGSLRITDTPGWRRIHRAIPAAQFTAAPVYRRSACAACHADAATGRFAPQQIAIPRG